MELQYHGKTCAFIGFARSTVLPEVFIVMQCGEEMLVAPTHDLSGLKHGGVGLNEIKVKNIFPFPRLEAQARPENHQIRIMR